MSCKELSSPKALLNGYTISKHQKVMGSHPSWAVSSRAFLVSVVVIFLLCFCRVRTVASVSFHFQFSSLFFYSFCVTLSASLSHTPTRTHTHTHLQKNKQRHTPTHIFSHTRPHNLRYFFFSASTKVSPCKVLSTIANGCLVEEKEMKYA